MPVTLPTQRLLNVSGQIVTHKGFIIKKKNLAVPVCHRLFIVIPHPRFSALQGMPIPSPRSWVVCKNETRKYKNETAIHMVNVLCYTYVTFSMQGEFHWWQIIHSMQSWLLYIDHLLIISSELNMRRLIKPWKWVNLEVMTQLQNTLCENAYHVHHT